MTDRPAPNRHNAQITVTDQNTLMALLGTADSNLRFLEKRHPTVDFHLRGDTLTLSSESNELHTVQRLVKELLNLAESGETISPDLIRRTEGVIDSPGEESPQEVFTHNIVSRRGRSIRPKTVGQKQYVDAIDTHTITFGIGPAGTGKTYLAMAKAVQALQAKDINRIILTRPAVEAGEKLGFLPGTLTEKIDPYLRPLYDALHDMLDQSSIPKLMETGTIEVVPLAFMRGRTLNDSFIILDEAQNTTPEQMKMFLTRLGFGSKIVVTGDVTQIDLPGGQISGLKIVEKILSDVEDVHFSKLNSHDVVRHQLVTDIVDAYEKWDVNNEQNAPKHRK
nr:PhoH family protein [Haloglycomyces albus]